MQTELTLRLKAQLDDLNKAVAKIKKSMEIDLSEGISNAMKGVSKNLKFKDLFSSEMKQINQKMRESANVALEFNLNKNIDKVKNGVSQIVATGATAYGTIGKFVKDSMDFEDSFADVKKVLDEATDATKLKEGILELSTTIGFSATELNKIAFSAGQMGLKGEKNILQFTELASKMGIAFDTNSEQAGSAMSKMLNIFNLSLDEVESLGDAINNLANNTNAEAMDIVDTLGRIGGAAKDFGLTAEQTAALSDSFLALGQSPEIAGTAIKNMLGKLNAGKKSVSKWFENMGLDYDSWAELKLKSPEVALRQFLGELGKLEGREKTLAITDMFGLENLDKISTLAGALQNYDKALELNKGDYKGSMNDEYLARASTTKFEFIKLKGTIDKISITIGDTLLPIINKCASAVNDMIKPLSNWIKSNQGIVEKVSIAIGLLFAFKAVTISASMATSLFSVVLYPLQKIFYLLRYTLAGNTLALIANKIATTILTIATKIFNLSLLKTRIALIATKSATIASAIATKIFAGATFLATNATKAWGVATQLFAKLFKVSMWSIKGALISTGIGALIVGLGLAIQYVCENWESIAPKLIAVWEWIKETISPVFDWLSDKFSWIGSGIDKILSGARSVSDFLGITDSNTSASLDTNGLIDKTIATQTQNAQNFYNNNKQSHINDNKTIYITTGANPNEVVNAIQTNSYSYSD